MESKDQKPGSAGLLFFACDLPATIRPVGVGFRIFAEAMGEQRARGGFRLRCGSAWAPRMLVSNKLQSQAQSAAWRSVEGYPSSMSKKKRVCVVTYRHSDGVLFENSPWPAPNMTNL
jgi:hypothetical protein